MIAPTASITFNLPSMKLVTKNLLYSGILLVALLLCSCTTPDPRFVENASKIEDISYPPGKIVGTWAAVYISVVQAQNVDSEGKVYYQIRPGGKGLMRQASKNTSTGESLSLEGDFTWKYLGANRWMINMPPSSEYRITSTSHMSMGYRPAVTFYVRYYNDELYITPGSNVWVRADREHVEELARRVRSAPPSYYGDRQ